MEQLVRIQSCHEDGTATVLHIRQSACSGDCHKCSGCGAVQEKLLFTAYNPIGAQPGQLVKVQTDSRPVLVAAAVLYLMPVLLFFLGYLLGQSLWQQGALLGCMAFAVGVVLAVLYDRCVAKKQKTVYTITGYGKLTPHPAEKGDKHID